MRRLRPRRAAGFRVMGCVGAPAVQGAVFEIAYPFVRETYAGFDGDGYADVPTWRPGIRMEAIGPEDSGAVADALGKAVFTVVDCFKPGRFPTRVFFTRKFVDPDGRSFGKGKLHIVTLEKFRRLALGYAHQFGIGEPLPTHWTVRQSREAFEQSLADHLASLGTPA